jgi:hypothetical protein
MANAKGSCLHASSASTMPSTFVAVAARGEGSIAIGKILDVYFKFAMGGDQYLGRILALLDPNEDSFATLPPHWKDPCHPSVFRAVKITFRNVLFKHGETTHNPTGLLSLLLASLIHHFAWIKSICSQYPDHPYSIPLLNEPKLLQELLDKHLTLEPSDNIPIAIGVPPSVKHSKLIKKVSEVCKRTDAKVDMFMKRLNKSVADYVSGSCRNCSVLDIFAGFWFPVTVTVS